MCVRVRPLVRNEHDANEMLAFSWEGNTITQLSAASMGHRKSSMIGTQGRTTDTSGNTTVSYTFDHLFAPEDTNVQIYESLVEHVVAQAMEGYHGAVFAYGQTSSGKTFTMHGTKKLPGIIPLAIHDCFDSIALYPQREFMFRVSYLEVR